MVSAIGINNASTLAPSAPSSVAGSSSSAAATSYDTFLKMLTTQLKHQDPLNPMEGSDFAVQLATFSGVEQQARANKLLEMMVTQSGGSLGQLADWIGKEVRTTEPVYFGDKALTLDISPDTRADSVTLIARNESGAEVSREEIGPGKGQIDWYGRTSAGEKLADGRYSFVIESVRSGEVISEDPVGTYVRVMESEIGPRGVELNFAGGGSALASDIKALREAD